MPAPIFIGDEIGALGYRLAGAVVLTPAAEDVGKVLRRARAEAELILISAEYAERLPERELEPMLAATEPLMLVVPSAGGAVPDLAAAISERLGRGP
jgi:vacuolar-type H+-ATPase subunit F/Vma7